MKKQHEIKTLDKPIGENKFYAECSKCKKVVLGRTETQVVYNMSTHFNSKLCKKRSFEQRVQAALPERTPGYSSKQEKVNKK